MKDREKKIKREIEELFGKPILVSIEDMNRLEKNRSIKQHLLKSTWHQWLISYFVEPIRNSADGLKDKIISALKDAILNASEEKTVSLFKINTSKVLERTETNKTKKKN